MNDHQPIDILLVEDNAEDLELTLRALHKGRVANRIEIARDGEEACDFIFGEGRWEGRAHASMPNLVMLDLNLPKVDGLEVLQRIKGDARTRSMPIVVLTSSQEQNHILDSYHLGVNGYIVKPVSFDRFSAAVAQLGLYWLLLNPSPRLEAP